MLPIPENDDAADVDLSLVGAHVIDAAGRRAQVVSINQTTTEPNAIIRIDHGAELVLPVSLLTLQQDGACRLPFAFDALSDHADGNQEMVIPVLQEALQVGKRVVDTGSGVRIRKTVAEREQIVDQPLLRDELVIEHVPIGQIVAAAQLPTTRYDGDTLIVPILEEVLVVEKQIRLKEEIRITRHRHQVHAPQTVMLKAEEVSVEHFDENGDASRLGNVAHSSARIQPDPGKPAG